MDEKSRSCWKTSRMPTAKPRAIRIDNGQFLKAPDGKEPRFGDSDLHTADTDMRLRSAIQQTLDMLALSDPDPDARRSAILKLGNSGKQKYVPILEVTAAKGKGPVRSQNPSTKPSRFCNSAIPTQLSKLPRPRNSRTEVHRQPG